MTLASMLKSARKARGLSVSEAATELRVSEPTLCDWEGKGTVPKLGLVRRLSELYGLDVAQVLATAEAEWDASTTRRRHQPRPVVASVFQLAAPNAAPQPRTAYPGLGSPDAPRVMCSACGKSASIFGTLRRPYGFICRACATTKEMA